jgi:hypothetical protein
MTSDISSNYNEDSDVAIMANSLTTIDYKLTNETKLTAIDQENAAAANAQAKERQQ